MVRREIVQAASPAGSGCEAVVSAAVALLNQCEAFVLGIPEPCYRASSKTICGGTVGKHLRHALDHFIAALSVVANANPLIDYDHRERGIPLETDRSLALQAIAGLRQRLALAAHEGLHRAVVVRVLLNDDGLQTQLRSTLGRELAFATHHAIHHQAMMKAIAAEFGVLVDDRFGKAPSTIQAERAVE